MIQCNCCNRVFVDAVDFTLHRTGDGAARRCLTSEEMVEKGLGPEIKIDIEDLIFARVFTQLEALAR